MIDLIAHNLAPIMFLSMVAFLLIGYPISFALAANGLLFFLIGVFLTPLSDQVNVGWNLLSALGDRVFGVMRNDTLLAIPFFTFMGIVLERSRMAEDLLDTIGQLFGPVRGGLAYAVVLVGALLAATTGVVAASVISMGLISLPIMMRYGYDRKLATGVIAASGTLAQIIPPSLVLIVLADQLGRSVGDMYKAAMIPALALTGIYMGYVAVMSVIRPRSMPALPAEARTLGPVGWSMPAMIALGVAVFLLAKQWLAADYGDDAGIWAASITILALMGVSVLDQMLGLGLLSRMTRQVIMVMIPPLALVFLVLGTIFLGIATPTEGGAMGAVGALILAGMKRRLSLNVVNEALQATARLSSFVMFILIGATVFSLTYYSINGHVWVEELLTALPGGEYGFLIAVCAIIFFLAFFLDFFELAFVIVPLLIPAANTLGIDLIWFGVILAATMQTSFLTPPVGFALFYLRSVAPRESYSDEVTGKDMPAVSTADIYRGAVPFVGLQVLMIALVILFPQMVMHYKGPVVDTSNIKIEIPTAGSGGGFGGLGSLGGSPFGQPAAPGGGSGGSGLGGGLGGGLGSGLGTPPGLGGAAPEAPADTPPEPPAESQPAAPGGLDLGGPPPGLGGSN
ncbi:TRAP transporter large permease [Paracoccus fistulariae]|uniref:TRAP transporter large permease subunit n=1 Tax=Paracoccus fistulariae TaxID=658446 RepID=A0ABY7SPH2_9RHOB|nr:TRAP transporter large permease subunit [Paracoccus fistulariae]MDB6179821.1 TRAP transporter large permease subunit [Paracoccus fistulariae]WCR07927.1 TRAP transporter large permease subunit [Paracoccus fistulariae]